MTINDRARQAAQDVREAIGAPGMRGPTDADDLERFDRFRSRRQRSQRLGAMLLATVLTAAAIALVVRAFGPGRAVRPAIPKPPGGTILFGRWDPNIQQGHWFTISADGSDVRDLHVVATCAQWWPDGSKILITNDAAVGPGTPLRPATIRPDGSGLHPLDATKDPNLNLGCGDVSPDGRRIVLEGFGNLAERGLYLVRASDGGHAIRLTYGSNANPQFSPDGSQVVFLRTKVGVLPDGAGALFVVNTDGTGLRRITPWGYAFLDQAWSPDGRWIVFSLQGIGQPRIAMVRPDGSGLRRVPGIPGGMTGPDWGRGS